jgi:hypothetical protein
MPILKLALELVPLVGHTERRVVAFLRGHTDLDAGSEFDKVADTPLGKRLRYKMDLWIAFKPDTKGKFHRFKNAATAYRECFVFIDIEEKMRLYGFTCHPDKADPSFELIVLTTHAIKKENETDLTELNRVLTWMKHPATMKAIQDAYPAEPKPEGK